MKKSSVELANIAIAIESELKGLDRLQVHAVLTIIEALINAKLVS